MAFFRRFDVPSRESLFMNSMSPGERMRSVSVTKPIKRPFSVIGSFLMLCSSMSLAASPARMSGDAVMMGLVMMSMAFTFLESLDSYTMRFSMSRSVSMPMGFPLWTTMRHPISCMFMSSAAFFTVAFGSMVTTFSVMIFLSFCDMKAPSL